MVQFDEKKRALVVFMDDGSEVLVHWDGRSVIVVPSREAGVYYDSDLVGLSTDTTNLEDAILRLVEDRSKSGILYDVNEDEGLEELLKGLEI